MTLYHHESYGQQIMTTKCAGCLENVKMTKTKVLNECAVHYWNKTIMWDNWKKNLTSSIKNHKQLKGSENWEQCESLNWVSFAMSYSTVQYVTHTMLCISNRHLSSYFWKSLSSVLFCLRSGFIPYIVKYYHIHCVKHVWYSF